MMSKDYQKVSDTLFTSEYITAAGEKLYLGMELLTKANELQLALYAHGGNRRCLASVVSQLISGSFRRGDVEDVIKSLDIQNKANVYQFMQKPATGKGEDYKNSGQEIMDCMGGALAGFSPTPTYSYVTYASSKPIPATGLLYNLPKSIEGLSMETLFPLFKENYGHLIMSVATNSLTNKDNNWYYNRGIMRNPISTLEGNYKGINLALHGFSALVAEKEFGKTELHVSPMGKMHDILKSSLPEGAILSKRDGAFGRDDGKTSYVGDNNICISVPKLAEYFLKLKEGPKKQEITEAAKPGSWVARAGKMDSAKGDGRASPPL